MLPLPYLVIRQPPPILQHPSSAPPRLLFFSVPLFLFQSKQTEAGAPLPNLLPALPNLLPELTTSSGHMGWPY